MTLVLGLLAAGCGGGDAAVPADTAAPATTPAPNIDPATGQPTAPVTDPVTGQTSVPTDGALVGDTGEEEEADYPGVNDIAKSTAAPGTAVKVSALTPKAFSKAHCRKPIIVVLYQPTAVLDERLLEEVRAAAKTVKDAVLLEYTPDDVREFGDLPPKLGLFAAPGVATVARNGEIGNFWTNYVDRVLIAKSLQAAAAATPCSVADDDAPAKPDSAFEDAAELAGA